MNRQRPPELSPVAIVFGGRSPIALACASALAQSHTVFLVTRNVDEDLVAQISDYASIIPIEGDLAREGSAELVVENIYGRGFEPTAVAFFQKYISKGQPDFVEHSRVELWSVAEALEAIARLKRAQTEVNAVISSSPAAYTVLNDQDVSYHVVKSGQEALVRYFGTKLQRQLIFVNAVRIGSLVIKPRAQKYWDSVPEVVTGLNRLSPKGKILSSADVGIQLARILAGGLSGITGQTFTVDGGFSSLDGAQLARAALEMAPINGS